MSALTLAALIAAGLLLLAFCLLVLWVMAVNASGRGVINFVALVFGYGRRPLPARSFRQSFGPAFVATVRGLVRMCAEYIRQQNLVVASY